VAADGVRQWLSCAGPGPTTLVVIPGLGATAASWTPVLAGMRQLVRTCVYDRPGLGHSPARPDRGTVVDAGGLADELWALLHAADERGPYLVLGHSFGGLIARAFVARHRPAVSGLLLAEGVTPDDRPLPRYWTEAGHPVDLPASSTATRGGPRLGSLPLVVLSASEPDRDHLDGPTYGQPTWMTLLWERQQRAATALSSDAIQVVARSGHVLQQDDPPAVVTSVRALLATVRTGSPLECVHAWATVRAICR
jgi:pimeloyl-ACP methyl ester carboxylesterase